MPLKNTLNIRIYYPKKVSLCVGLERDISWFPIEILYRLAIKSYEFVDVDSSFYAWHGIYSIFGGLTANYVISTSSKQKFLAYPQLSKDSSMYQVKTILHRLGNFA